MAILLDGSAILAAADQSDLNHRAALAWFSRVDEPLMIGALTLGEVDLLLQRELGLRATLALLESIGSGAVRVVSPTQADLARAAELLRETSEYRPRLADAVLVATAERLGITRVAAFDRRPIAVFHPRHIRAFDLEP
jgi:predicted nucleic acid-binding protein